MQAPVSDADIQAYCEPACRSVYSAGRIRYSIIQTKTEDDAESGTGCAEQGEFRHAGERNLPISSLRVMAAIWAGWKSLPRCRN